MRITGQRQHASTSDLAALPRARTPYSGHGETPLTGAVRNVIEGKMAACNILVGTSDDYMFDNLVRYAIVAVSFLSAWF